MRASTIWLHQRLSGLSSLLLIPLLWKGIFLVKNGHYNEITALLQLKLSAFVIIPIYCIAIYHARLGFTIVIEDYVCRSLHKILLRIVDVVGMILMLLVGYAFYVISCMQKGM